MKTVHKWLGRLAPAARLDRAERDALIAQLASDRQDDRWRAAAALSAGDPGREGIAALTLLLGNADPMLRWEAAAALASSGVPAAQQALLGTLTGDDPVAQAAAADGLGQCPLTPTPPEVVASLTSALSSPGPMVRQSAAEALARLAARPAVEKAPVPGGESVPVLLATMQSDPVPLVRRAAALAVGHIGAPEARAALEACQTDPREDPLVREAAATALTRLRTPAPPPIEESQAAIPAEPEVETDSQAGEQALP